MAPRAAQQTDVLILGGGIAGAALACALRDSGLDVVVVEKSAEPLDTARGDHLQPRTAEILERWGVLADFLEAGADKRLGSAWYDAEGQMLLRSSVADLELPNPYYLFLNHELIGATLLGAALRSSSVELLRPVRNWWFDGQEGGRTRIRAALEQEERLFDARVVIGADGRSSRVRKQFGFAAESHGYERPIVVMFADDPRANPHNELEAHLNDRQMVALIPRTGGGVKIGVPVARDDVAGWRQADRRELSRRLTALVPARAFTNVTLSDVYPPVYLRASQWVDGNVVLIGDAAHAMHPARSQGMNVAIRCVDALAEALVQGCSGRGDVATALAAYERRVKPGIDAMLAKNHEHGLQMDRTGAEAYARACVALRGIAADPEARRAFALNAAGYPHAG